MATRFEKNNETQSYKCLEKQKQKHVAKENEQQQFLSKKDQPGLLAACHYSRKEEL